MQKPSQRRALRFYIEKQQPSCPGVLYWLLLILLILIVIVGVMSCEGGESIPVGLLGGAGLLRRGAGKCEVCGKTLMHVSMSRCAVHATLPPAGWKMKMLKPVVREADSWDRDVEAQRA